MSMMEEHDDRCPVCGGQDIYSTDSIESDDCETVVYKCPDCGASFEAVYIFDRFENITLPDTFDGIIRAAVHLGNENPDDVCDRMKELVNECVDIRNSGREGYGISERITEIR